MAFRFVVVLGLFAAGVTYAWFNGWLSRREEREHDEHAGRMSWGPGRQTPQPGI